MSVDFERFFGAELVANTLHDYLMALLVVVVSVLVLWVFKYIIIKRAKRSAQHTKGQLDDAVIATLNAFNWPFYAVVALYVASYFLQLPDYLHRWGAYIILIVVAYYGAKAVSQLLEYGIKQVVSRNHQADEDYNDTTLNFVGKLLKAVLWVTAGILVLQNLGYQITTLVAGLGVGGIAVAFALQNVLSDIFASFSIYFDKPFQVDDYIAIGKDSGIVKKIGLKSTRLKTLQGEELIISNQKLTEARVHNFKKMDCRRVSFKIGIVYEISQEKLQQVPKIIEEMVLSQDDTEIERITFNEFGESGLIFETIYYLGTREYGVFRETQSKINYAIKEKFDAEGIEMAYPTQNLYIKNSQAA